MKNNQPERKQVCLALQGGGAYGAYSWGILDRILEDKRLSIDAISATSAGTLNAVMLVNGFAKNGPDGARQALSDFWTSVSEYGAFFSPVREMFSQNFLEIDYLAQYSFALFNNFCHIFSPYLFNPFNLSLLRIIIQEKIDFNLLNSSKIHLFLCATNVKTGKLRIFENNELNTDVILASACLPHLEQAVVINNEYYWDGGFIGNPPIFPLIYQCETHDIIIVHNNPIFRETIPKSAQEIANRTNEITFNSSLMRELRAIHFVTDLIQKDMLKDKYKGAIKLKFTHMIRSDEVMQKFTLLDKYRWNLDFLLHLRDLGRKSADDWLAKHFDSIGAKSTINFNEFI